MDKSLKKIFCIIPAYNEGENVLDVLRSISSVVDKVVVIDDGSSDNTHRLVSQFITENQTNIYLLRHEINRGQGASLQTGNDFAVKEGADIVVHFDSDGQFLSEEVNEVVRPIIEDGVDIVFGSRFLDKKSSIPFFKKIFILPIARFVNKVLFNATLSDPQSGFRAMNLKSLRVIKIEQDRMAHCSEIIEKAFKNNLKITERPISVIYKNFGQNFSGGVRVLFDLIFYKIIK